MIYLDNNATTFLDPRVAEQMDALLRRPLGNPSSTHRYGQEARALLGEATREVAHFFSVSPSEILFTSGATEGLNMAIRSVPPGRHILTSSLEHSAVLEACKCTGCEVTYLDPEPGRGAITPAQVEAALRPETALLVFMAANNETGVCTDLPGLAALAEASQIPLVVDGVGIVGKGNCPLPRGVSAFCLSSHKIHGPTGVGVVVIRKSLPCTPLIVGGPQQRRLRGGTEPLVAILGCAQALKRSGERCEEVAQLRDYFEHLLVAHIDQLVIHGRSEPRVNNTTSVAFLGVEGEELLIQLDMRGIAASHGAACASGALEPSRVLLHMGLPEAVVRSTLRFSLSRFTTREEVERTVSTLHTIVASLRTSPFRKERP